MINLDSTSLALLSRDEIARRAREGMIVPFVPEKVRDGISYGLTETGYDLRLSSTEFRLITGRLDKPIDPLDFNLDLETTRLPLCSDDRGRQFFVMPPHSYGLGVAVERLAMPDDVVAIAVGKSTYARVAVIANITPAEPGWEGYLTLELHNASDSPVRLYAGMGIVQLLFLRCANAAPYDGKYQGQSQVVTPALIDG